jgi:NADH dehydrogenase/NADH:ubiquinone oxidoreductase subunit G
LGEKRAGVIQNLIDEVIELFGPMARREWVSWGGEYLFSGLKEDMEEEEREAEAKRLWDAEEEAKRVASEAKEAALEVQRQALAQARESLRSDFRAKRITKEELRARNLDLEEERRIIERENAGSEGVEDDEGGMTGVRKERGGVEIGEPAEDEEGGADLPVTAYGKRKAVDLDEEGEDEIEAK